MLEKTTTAPAAVTPGDLNPGPSSLDASRACPDCGQAGARPGHMECPYPTDRLELDTLDHAGPWGAP